MRAMDMRVENRENKLENNLRTADAVDIGRRKEAESKKGEGVKRRKAGRARQGMRGRMVGIRNREGRR